MGSQRQKKIIVYTVYVQVCVIQEMIPRRSSAWIDIQRKNRQQRRHLKEKEVVGKPHAKGRKFKPIARMARNSLCPVFSVLLIENAFMYAFNSSLLSIYYVWGSVSLRYL